MVNNNNNSSDNSNNNKYIILSFSNILSTQLNIFDGETRFELISWPRQALVSCQLVSWHLLKKEL